MAVTENVAGVARIKQEFLFHEDRCVSNVDNVTGPPEKKIKLGKNRGQNKNRFHQNQYRYDKTQNLCHVLVDVREGATAPTCDYQGCKNIHDVNEYLKIKPQDLGKECYVYETKGHCPRGVTCRFASKHITPDGKNKIIPELAQKYKNETPNRLLSKELQVKLRKRLYDFTRAEAVVKLLTIEKLNNDTGSKENESCNETENLGEDGSLSTGVIEDSHLLNNSSNIDDRSKVVLQTCSDAFEGNKNRDKKKIDWRGKLYLSPLTTVGNLPFRRICKEWGADITCGEMAMAHSLLKGEINEWALLKRHTSETIFGVQLCGSNPSLLAKCVQLVEESAEVDFIDLNLGCPIELVYRNGGGSALLSRRKQLDAIVNSMSQTTLNIPITVKTRTGVYDRKNVAHTYMPLFTSGGASLITVHGRSKEQRYTRQADWDYANECARLAVPTPVFGNGDILSFQDYNSVLEKYTNISGVMIGRGALYKPWIFTEIKEQREWDISSSERLDILRKFVNYGFEHWGSDLIGVEKTRRFLLEWISFLHRYIPVGLLEKPPQRINERPPRYIGRDDLETLMASSNSADWVKISEMLCGPVPENYQFLPKHKANSWGSI